MTDDKKRIEDIKKAFNISGHILVSEKDIAFLLAQIDKRNEVLRKIVADCNCVGRCPCLTDKAREALGDE